MEDHKIRERLIDGGVKGLVEFGYPGCTNENILTDRVYSAFFLSMLAGTRGQGKQVDAVIDALVAEIPKPAPDAQP